MTKVTRARKSIGLTMMIIGGVCLLPFGLLFVALLVDGYPIAFCSLSAFLLAAFAIRKWRLSRRVALPLLLGIPLIAFCCHRFGTAEGILAGYGVHYNHPNGPAFASPSLNEVQFWFEGPHGRLPGPDFVGDLLVVEKPYRTRDGHLEFAVQSSVKSSERMRIQLVFPPEGDVAFHIVDPSSSMLSVSYPNQKEFKSWP